MPKEPYSRKMLRLPRLFIVDKRGSYKGDLQTVSKMWRAMPEEERMEYKAKCRKLKTDWKREAAEWEEKNRDNPKMAELKAYKVMLESAKTWNSPDHA